MIETNPTLKPPLGSGGGQIARAAICALVFLAGGSIVYWTAARQTAAPKNYQATATIVEHSPTAGGPNTVDLIRTFRPDPEAIRGKSCPTPAWVRSPLPAGREHRRPRRPPTWSRFAVT